MTQPDEKKTNSSVLTVIIVVACIVLIGLPMLVCGGFFLAVLWVGESSKKIMEEVARELEKEKMRQAAPLEPGAEFENTAEPENTNPVEPDEAAAPSLSPE